MKLVTFKNPAGRMEPRVGAVTADGAAVVDLQAAQVAKTKKRLPAFSDMLSLLDDFDRARDAADQAVSFGQSRRPKGAVHALSDLALLSPVPRPRTIRDCMTFQRHYVQAARTVAKWKFPPLARVDRSLVSVLGRGLLTFPKIGEELPIYYMTSPLTVVGTGADITWPHYTEKLDFEMEFGVFLGRTGKDIHVRDAAKHIAGYAIFNDVSARDQQMKEMAGKLGPTKSKNFDGSNVIGPWLVTTDEVPDPQALSARVRINGDTWSETSTREMSFTFPEIIAYISRDETLHPGEFIGSGTMPDGCGLEMDRWIHPGDVIALEVERLGTLRNRVVRRA